ncbi:MAG: AbrB family transcriptional regulator, partial [Hyphomicrobiaceae bacterium]
MSVSGEQREPGDWLGRIDRGLARAGLNRASAARLLLGFVIGFAGAGLFILVHLPLPWFLGSLTACIAASVANLPFDRPNQLSISMRAVLGVAVGAAFTPELLARFGSMTVSLALLFPFMIMIIGLGMLYFERVAKYDRPTAFFCAVPGGLTDMVTMAADAGANPRTVTLVQATRIVLIVFLLPFWLTWVGGRTIGIFVPGAVHLHQFLLVDAVVLVALGWVGWRLAERIGLAGAPLVGPMILSGLAHAMGLTTAKLPLEVLIFAQVTLGILLGAQFRGLTFREFSSTMMLGAGFSLVLVIMTGLVALLVSRLTGFDSTTVLLAYAPGGQSELNLLAFILNLD